MPTPEQNLVVEPGTAVSYVGEFLSADNVLTDPDKVGFALIDPSAKQTDFVYGTHPDNVEKIETGRYRFTVIPQVKGSYEIQVAGSGAIAVTGRAKFTVAETRFTSNWLATA
ncbi:MAG: hypothetical protein AAFO83_00245 [Cyanobacteria bacterium J06607_13]